ncbi:MAG: hypothetical protein SOY73_14995 [Blautia sp.]|nr:hypothetical protein [Blautia sp.]
MRSKKDIKVFTVSEFLAETKGKRYQTICSDTPKITIEMKGNDITKSFRMDTVERIYSYEKGSYVLDYGERMPRYAFKEIAVSA